MRLLESQGLDWSFLKAMSVNAQLASGLGMSLTSALPRFHLRSLSFSEQADVQLMPSILQKRGKGSFRMEEGFVPAEGQTPG